MDERYFEDDATMRLVDRDRAALGVEPSAARWRTSSVSELGSGYHEEPIPERAGATLLTYLTAHPASGLIPGAVVTVAVAVTNDGVAPARDARLVVALPEAARYVPGTAKRDGRPEPDAEAEALLGEGLELGTLAPGQRVSFIVLLGIEPGIAPLHLAANVSSANGAVVGARPLLLTRSAATSAFGQTLAATPAVDEPERPFYELDPEEELVYEAVDAALGTAAPAPPPPVAEPPVPPPVAEPPAKRARPETFGVELQGGALFTVALPRARLAFLAQLFGGAKSLGMVAHYLMLNALAAVDPLPHTTDDSLAAFAATQEQRLSRAIIAKRMGKALVPEEVAAPLPEAFPPRLVAAESADLPVAGTDGEALLLFRIMRPNELSFLSASVNNTNAAPFMRASQLFVGLAAHNAVVAGETRRAEVANALRGYSAAAASEVNRLFVRARLSRQTDLFGSSPIELDRQAAQLAELLDRTT